MKNSTSQERHGIRWICWVRLDDLNFTDDLAPLSYTHQQMQVKTTSVADASASVGLNIHKGKRNILKHNRENTNPVTLHEETQEEVGVFTYLGSIIDEQGRSNADVKARAAFLQLKNIWNSKQLYASRYQSQNLLYERQDSPTVRS
ncbi:unnamed protein product [Schistosoma margrebowiei]|uniref:Uncharacterized protein n=1 Tax=Schistosoma margrebowiei TaxID=48269 RepID=A0A183L9H8_9TREM|nr:unnamed protein product [Schistosoma margrebowiei]